MNTFKMVNRRCKNIRSKGLKKKVGPSIPSNNKYEALKQNIQRQKEKE